MARNINNPQENFYIILELDYDKPETNANVIKDAIAEKTKEWSFNKNNPAKASYYEKYLQSIKEMEKLMLIQGDSDEETAELKKLRKEEALAAQRIVYGPLDAFIAKAVDSNEITEEKIKALVGLFNRKNPNSNISESKFKERLPSSVKIVKSDQSSASASASDTIEAPTKKKLETNLSLLGFKDLYEFLGISSNASEQEMYDIATKKYNEFSKKAKTAENTASSILAGEARSISKPEKRKKYDNYLNGNSLDEVKDDIEIATAGGDMLSLAASTKLIEKIMQKMGCSQEKARDTLEDMCKKLNRSAVLPDLNNSATVKLVRCGICGRVVEKGTKVCPSCSSPMTVTCQKCGTVNETSSNSCSKCGHSFKNGLIAKKHCDKAVQLIESSDFEEAENELYLAEYYDPENKEVSELKKRLKGSLEAVGSSVEAIKSFIEERKFFAAKAEIIALQKKAPTVSVDSFKMTVKSGISDSTVWVERAKNSASEKEIIEFASKAVELCVDNAEAKALLVKYPPMAASNIRGRVSEDTILLRWDASPSEGVVYKLLRKRDSAPQNDTDGDLLGDLSTNYYEDKSAAANKNYFYTVFACRGGITSPGVATKMPLCHFQNVNDALFIAGDGSVTITWEMPADAKEAIIVKNENNYPEGIDDGTVLVPAGKYYEDKKLTNGKVYYYKIFAVYLNNNVKMYSSGVAGKAIPSTPVKPIESFEFKKLGENTYGIKWEHPSADGLVFYYSKEKKDLSIGAVKDRIGIEKSLSLLPVLTRSENKTKVSVESDEVYYVYPVMFNGDAGTFCQSFIINNVSGFPDLEAPAIRNDAAYITLDWPQNATHAHIAYKTTGYASSHDDSAAEQLIVSKEQYDKNSAVVIRGIEKQDYYITVFAVYGSSDSPVYSAGTNVVLYNSPQSEMVYSFKYKKGLFSKKGSITLLIESQQPINLPKAVVVKKSGSIPALNIGEGIIVAEINPVDKAQSKHSVTFDDNVIGNACYKLFLRDENDYRKYKLMAKSAKDIIIRN